MSEPRPVDAMATLRELLGADTDCTYKLQATFYECTQTIDTHELVDAIDGLIKQRIAETLTYFTGFPFLLDDSGHLIVHTQDYR
jgi:hypothetical protein